MKHDGNTELYINIIGPAARVAMLKTGIPASFLIADLCAVSQFGKIRVANICRSERADVIEPYLSKYENRWTLLMNKATGIRSYYKLKGDQKPLPLLRFLEAKGFYGNAPAEAAATVANLIKQYRLTKWDRMSPKAAHLIRRTWYEEAAVILIQSQITKMRRYGVRRRAVLDQLRPVPRAA